jgi:hypothetical protein
MKRFLRLTAIVIISGLAMLAFLDFAYTWAIAQKPLSDIKKDQHYDYLIAGDSRTNALLPSYLNMITGMKTINIGYPAYTLEDNRRVMEYFFERGNKADKVFLQVDLRFCTATEVKREWYYKPYLIGHEGYFAPARFPFSYYALHNKNITFMTVKDHLLYSLKSPQEKARFDSMEVVNDYRPFRYNDKLLEDHANNPLLLNELYSFERMLKKNGVKELVLFTAPFSPNWFHSQSDTSTYKRRLVNAGFKYFDLSTIYQDTTYFKDYTHIKNNKYLEFCRHFVENVIQQQDTHSNAMNVSGK